MFTNLKAYELCLMDYDLAILDNAFLVHAPGIKKLDDNFKRDEERRKPSIWQNNKIFITIIKELRKKYGNNYKC